MNELSIERAEADGEVRVLVDGELDLATASQLDDALRQALRDCAGAVIVDLSRVTFMDSSGLRSMLDANRAAQEAGCRLAVVPGPAAARLFELSRIGDELELLEGAPPPADGLAPSTSDAPRGAPKQGGR